MISIIIPVLNEQKALPQTLTFILKQKYLPQRLKEIIIVDGGSDDDSVIIAQEFSKILPIKIISAKQGRASQMNTGAKISSAPWLLFLHADTQLPLDGLERLYQSTKKTGVLAVCFKQTFSGNHLGLKFISWLHNLRFHQTKIIYGDQAMMVKRDTFIKVGRFPEQKTEDVLFSRKLLALCTPIMLNAHVVTDSRKFEQIGTWRTLLYVIDIQFQLRLSNTVTHQKFFQNYR